jgi:hypothetical protein
MEVGEVLGVEVVEVLDVDVGGEEVAVDSKVAAIVSSGTSAAPTLSSKNTALPAKNRPAKTAMILSEDGDTGGARVKARRG